MRILGAFTAFVLATGCARTCSQCEVGCEQECASSDGGAADAGAASLRDAGLATDAGESDAGPSHTVPSELCGLCQAERDCVSGLKCRAPGFGYCARYSAACSGPPDVVQLELSWSRSCRFLECHFKASIDALDGGATVQARAVQLDGGITLVVDARLAPDALGNPSWRAQTAGCLPSVQQFAGQNCLTHQPFTSLRLLTARGTSHQLDFGFGESDFPPYDLTMLSLETIVAANAFIDGGL